MAHASKRALMVKDDQNVMQPQVWQPLEPGIYRLNVEGALNGEWRDQESAGVWLSKMR